MRGLARGRARRRRRRRLFELLKRTRRFLTTKRGGGGSGEGEKEEEGEENMGSSKVFIALSCCHNVEDDSLGERGALMIAHPRRQRHIAWLKHAHLELCAVRCTRRQAR